MSEEFFDVVNERDEVVGCASRREVHARRLRHRAVHVLIFDRAGRIFLQKRSMKKDMSPGKWDSSSSGHLDTGEDYDTAAVRELGEELGWRTVVLPERWFRVEACVETGEEFVWVYRLRGDGPFTLNGEEIDRGDWFTPPKITAWMRAQPDEFAPAFRLIWGLAEAKMAGDIAGSAPPNS